MTRVDFYVVADMTDKGRWLVACRLAEKAYTKGHPVHVHMADQQQANDLDKLMWTFRDGGFLPHACIEDSLPQQHPNLVPVLIGAGAEPRPGTEILINMCNDVPGFFSQIDRVMEIVGGDESSRAAARERFKFYRDRGYDLNSYNV